MSLELYQDVILTADLPEHGLCAGDVGVLVDRHSVPGKPEGFSVEFFRHDGNDRGRGYPSLDLLPRAHCRGSS
jgi:hypothetical protein